MELFYIENDQSVKEFVNLCARMEFIAANVVKVLEQSSVASEQTDLYARSIKQGIMQLSHYACKVAELDLAAKIKEKSSISDDSDE